jgi:hypothetical protein
MLSKSVRTVAIVERELRAARLEMLKHPVGSRLFKLAELRKRNLAAELAMCCGALSVGAL